MSHHLFKYPLTNTAATASTTVLPITETTSRKEVLDNSSSITYPPALATYDEVVADPCLFRHTLEKLHRFMRTKFMVPTVGGKALNLHRLFVEVTARGGLENVIRHRKWKEVIPAFNFPSTITNAAFTLRKCYISLLQPYEQIYFFQKQGQQNLTNETNNASAAANIPVQAATTSPQENITQENQAGPSSGWVGTGCSVIGTINGKFENGYLVTVTIGSEELNGFLYHAPDEQPPVNHCSDTTTVRRHNRKRSRRALDDPFRPKQNRSGYNFFFQEHFAKLSDSGEVSAITKRIAHLWNQLSEAEKEVYQEKATKDKERYQNELLEYRKSSTASMPK